MRERKRAHLRKAAEIEAEIHELMELLRAMPRCLCGELLSSRQRYCSRACQQRAYRARQGAYEQV